MQPTLLAIAKADLKTAKSLVGSTDKFQKHQAAYFTQQAIYTSWEVVTRYYPTTVIRKDSRAMEEKYKVKTYRKGRRNFHQPTITVGE